MLPHQNCLSSFNPVFHTCSNCQIDHGEFNFWTASETQQYKNASGRDDNEMEFPVQHAEEFNESLWKSSASSNIMHESYPLLPHNHAYSNISPRSRSQAIAEGRRALMEIINNMPESSYELSLKDIVDLATQEAVADDVSQETSFQFSSEQQIKKQIKKKTSRFSNSGQISRSGSMEKQTFLIRMFIPISLSWKTKGKGGIVSKVSARPSFDGSENHVDKELWLKRWLFTREGKNSGRSSSSRSTTSSSSRSASSSNSSSRCRQGNTKFHPACWPFFCTQKKRSNRHGGCIC